MFAKTQNQWKISLNQSVLDQKEVFSSCLRSLHKNILTIIWCLQSRKNTYSNPVFPLKEVFLDTLGSLHNVIGNKIWFWLSQKQQKVVEIQLFLLGKQVFSARFDSVHEI